MKGLRILIGDGSAFMRIMLREVLETLGFEVVATAKDGKEVLDRFVEIKPDIALIDLAVEGMEAAALTREIIADEPSAKVILMVPEGLDDPNVIVEVVRAGVRGYIKKPVSAEELKARIASALKRE